MADRRVTIQWTETAKEGLAKLPLRARRGLLARADTLYECRDPRTAFKALVGPLGGYYRIRFSRYRAIYMVRDEELPNGDVFVHVHVCFVAAGLRREGDRKDVYQFAQRLIQLGVLEPFDPRDDTTD